MKSNDQTLPTVFSRARGWISACDKTVVCDLKRSTSERTNGRMAAEVTSCDYSGLSPSASNCRLHSVGGSRSRSMPMPRGQAAFYGCFDKIRGKEGERDCHVDLRNAAFLPSAELCDRGHST